MNKLIMAIFVALCLIASASATTITVASNNISVTTYDPLYSYAEINSTDWINPVTAVNAWVHGSWPTIAGASWISTAYNVENARPDSWRLFNQTIEVPDGRGCELLGDNMISVDSDNAEEVYLNGNLIGSDGDLQTLNPPDNQEWSTVKDYPLTGLQNGPNTLQVIVRNYAYGTDDPQVNPTGLIYKADINYVCSGGDDNNVPEFGVIAAAVAMIGAVGGIVLFRRH